MSIGCEQHGDRERARICLFCWILAPGHRIGLAARFYHFLAGCVMLLSRCSTTLQQSVQLLVGLLLTLAQDEWEPVAKIARAFLQDDSRPKQAPTVWSGPEQASRRALVMSS